MRYDCESMFKWRRSESSLNVNRAYKKHVEKQDTQMKTTTAAAAAVTALTATAHATTFTVSSPTTDRMMMIICWTCSPMFSLLLSLVVVVVASFFSRAVQSFVYAVRFSLLSPQTNQSNTLPSRTTDNAQLNNDCNEWLLFLPLLPLPSTTSFTTAENTHSATYLQKWTKIGSS